MKTIKHDKQREDQVAHSVLSLLVRMNAENNEIEAAIKKCQLLIKLNNNIDKMKARRG